jgi:hypothetical protein
MGETMRDDINKAIEAARLATPPVPPELYNTLVVMGELLSRALDRIDKLEGEFPTSPDVLPPNAI